MRTLHLFSAIAVVSLAAGIACQKAKVVPAPASITIVHAMAGANAIVPKFGTDTAGRYYKGASSGNTMVKVNYGASQLYSRVAGDNPLLVVPSTDTVFKVFNGSMTLNSGDIYSFFLSGDTAHADTLLVKDNIPYYGDSSAGVRFVNLSIGGKSLTINLASDPAHTPIAGLGYRQITGFMPYDARTSAGASYSFEVRDQATGDSLTTYEWTYPRFRNNTLVIAGSTDPGSLTPLKIFSVNNY
jgi:hypothetical protein